MSLLGGHVSPSEGTSPEMAAVTTERWYMAPGIKRIDIRQNGVVGTLFLPPGEQKKSLTISKHENFVDGFHLADFL